METKFDVDALLQQLQFTHTELRKIAMLDARNNITALLRISDAKYSQFIYGNGLRYLHYLTDADEKLVNMLEKNTLFWAWWRDWHTVRDEAFLKEFYVWQTTDTIKLYNTYLIYNDALTLLSERKPPKEIIAL